MYSGFECQTRRPETGSRRKMDRDREEETRRRMRMSKKKRMAKVGWLKGYLVQDG